jgi:dephospho-CoA kinase
MTTRRVPIIGIVGGIGSGKSALARAFEALGCRRLDADTVGHEMLRKAEVFAELVQTFGEEILDDGRTINRSRLAARAFASEAATADLNRIVGGALWPELRRRALEAADHAGPEVPAVVIDAALIYESETDEICDSIIFVDCLDEVRRQRVAGARGWVWDEVLRREARQFPLSRKRGLADEHCANTAGLEHLQDEARRILELVRKLFLSPNVQPECNARKSTGPTDTTI